jgi:hypothetical protein
MTVPIMIETAIEPRLHRSLARPLPGIKIAGNSQAEILAHPAPGGHRRKFRLGTPWVR